MVFRRRRELNYWEKGREFVWPSSGWRRAFRYLWWRIVRMPGTPYNIAAGLACGAAISMTPMVGVHFVLSAIMAWIIGGNIIASAIGTAVGNPWTFPFIWVWTFYLGNLVLGTTASLDVAPPDLSLSLLVEHPWRVFLPMLIGSIPTALTTWLVVFFSGRAIVSTFQARRRRRRQKKAHRHAAMMREGRE